MECSTSQIEFRQTLHMCRGCLKTDCVLYDLREKKLVRVYSDLTGLSIPGESHKLMCATCLHLLRKFGLYRAQCLQAARLLQRISSHNVVLNIGHSKFNPVSTPTQFVNIDPSSHVKEDPKDIDFANVSVTSCLHVELEPKSLEPKSPKTEIFADVIHSEVIIDVKQFDQKRNCNIETPTIERHNEETNEALVSNAGDIFSDKDAKLSSESSDDDDDKILTDNISSDDDDDDDDDYSLSDFLKKELAKVSMKDVAKVKWVNVKRIRKNDNQYKIKNIKVNKNLPEDRQMIKELAERFKNMVRWNGKTKNKMDIYGVFEMLYNESVAAKEGVKVADEGTKLDKANQCLRQELRVFLDVTNKLSKALNMEVNFLSVEEQKREIEEKRKTRDYKDARYKCEICCKTFNFLDTYERHSLAHKQYLGGELCAICHYRFKGRKQLMQHLHTMHEKKLKCKECGFVIRTWLLAKEHHESHKGINITCKFCDKTFNERKLHYMHLRKAHKTEIGTERCALCQDLFNGKHGLRLHMDRAHKQAVQCPSCAGWLHSPGLLAAHAQAGCRPGHSCCSLCGASFATEELLQRHNEEQHKESYLCEQCNKSFANKTNFKFHVTQRHGNAAVRAARLGPPARRVRSARGSRSYVCDVCGKNGFPFLSCLKTHQRQHRAEHPFQCEVCRKRFTEFDALKVHSLIHAGEARHQCPHCPKTFRQKGNRDTHVLLHTKVKAHSCPVCLRKFAWRSNMIKHVKTVHREHPVPPPMRKPRNRSDD